MVSYSPIEIGTGVARGERSFDAAVEAAATAVSSIEHHAVSVVFVYASVRYELGEVLRGVNSIVGADVPVIGATTAGEICNGTHAGSVVVVALASPHVAVHCAIGRDVAKDWTRAVDETTSAPAVSRFFEPTSDVWRRLTREGKSVFAMLIVPGNTRHHDSRSFEILEALKAKAQGRFPVIAGAAADDWQMQSNFVFFGREAFADSLIVAIFETRLQFGIALTHGFRTSSTTASITGVSDHEVLTINGLPAADEYCKLLGTSREALEGKHVSLATGRMIGTPDAMGQYSVIVSTFFTKGNGCRLGRPFTPGTVITVMEPNAETMVSAGSEALRKAILRGGITEPAVALVHYCALRPRIMGEEASNQEVAGMLGLMGNTPVVGFYSFGEGGVSDDGVSRHNNAAVSALVIGMELSPSARVALEADKLRNELERKASELEQTVAERTRELSSSNATLRRTQEFLDTIIENVPAMLFVKEAREHRFVLINRAGEELLGLSRKDLIGKNDYDLFPKEKADLFVARDREVLQSGSVIEEEQIHTRHKGVRVLTTTKLAILGEDGKPQYLLGVGEDITERKQATARIAHMARHDALTDLPNRTSFGETLASTIDRATADCTSFALMCIDLDRFKEVNDVFGHSAGDALLCEVSKRLVFAAGHALVARLGGDEFTVIVTAGEQPSATAQLAARLQAALADNVDIEGHQLRIGLSIGVAVFPADGTDAGTLLGNADAALYRAKADGRGSVRFFEADMDQHLHERRVLQHDLRSAVAGHQLLLHYQPQAHIDGEVVGFEALARWRHPCRGLVAPNTFIPLAEESGLIIPLGEWVLREACREAASWPHPLQVAINLSPVQFQHGDLPGLVHSVLLQTGLEPGRLELEVTERVLVGDFSRAVSLLRRLKSLGVKIAMDDFGTGYSSLSYLQSFPFDKIKIDRAFISNLNRNPQSAAIIRAVIGLCRGLGMSVAAEGVETSEQLAFLSNEACNEVQGYLLGRPLPIEAYAAMVGRPQQKSIVAS